MKKITYLIFVSLQLLTFSLKATITITGPNPTVWSTQTVTNPYLINDNIVVEDGGVLDVYVDLHFAQGYGITVKKGGLLMIREGITLTTQGSNYLWEGIIIEGTNGQKVLPIDNILSNQGGAHGVVLIREATITNAKVGITVGGNGNSGGLLQAFKGIFLNNGISIRYNSFSPPTSDNNKGNANYLRKCEFIQTGVLQESYDRTNRPKSLILLDGYEGGVTIRGCNFETDYVSMANVVANNTIGINSINGTRSILLDEATDETIDGYFDAGRRNTFSKLHKGVYIGNSNPLSTPKLIESDFRNADFIDVLVCYHIKNSSLFNVDCNNYNSTSFNDVEFLSFNYELVDGGNIFGYHADGFASCFTWLENSVEFNIRNNSMEWNNGFIKKAAGLIVYKSGGDPNSPSYNIANNSFNGTITESNNNKIYGCYLLGQNTRIELTCNTFINLWRDIRLVGTDWCKFCGVGQGKYIKVLETQGGTSLAYNNTFTNNSTYSGRENIFSNVDLTYHYIGSPIITNTQYPFTRFFDPLPQAIFSGIQNTSPNVACASTSCIPFVDTKKSELLTSPKIIEEGTLVSPNPSNGKFAIKSNYQITKIKVYNLTGQLIYEDNNLKTQDIEIHHLPEGIYYALIFDSNGASSSLKLNIVK